MGLRDTRAKAIACLKQGKVQAENRSDIREKNLLKTGVVSAEVVIQLLIQTRGGQYRTEPHKDAPEILVHYFEPNFKGEDWHIKFYFIEPDCYFISVHKSHIVRTTKKAAGRSHGNLQRRR